MNNFERVECLRFVAEKIGGSYTDKIGLALEIMGEFNNLNLRLVQELGSSKKFLKQCEKEVSEGASHRYPSAAIGVCSKDLGYVIRRRA